MTIPDEPTFCPTCDSDRTERKMLPDIWWCADCGNTFDGPSGLGHASVAETTLGLLSTPGDEKCGWTWPSEDVICTMLAGHPGPHGSWAFQEDES